MYMHMVETLLIMCLCVVSKFRPPLMKCWCGWRYKGNILWTIAVKWDSPLKFKPKHIKSHPNIEPPEPPNWNNKRCEVEHTLKWSLQKRQRIDRICHACSRRDEHWHHSYMICTVQVMNCLTATCASTPTPSTQLIVHTYSYMRYPLKHVCTKCAT